LFAFGQAKRKSILHFVKLRIRFSNLPNFFLLRAMGDSMRFHICASEYSSEYHFATRSQRVAAVRERE
ncbi:MAG TPA: hypothetical protein PK475_08670, partial [Rectinema sp.]|nr:hypothetical protein [Rectinema sp.]